MVNVTFNLRNPNETNETPINCNIRYSGNRISLATKQKIKPSLWSKAKSRVKASSPLATETNAFLDKVQVISNKEFTKFLELNGREPLPNELKQSIENELFGIKDRLKQTIPNEFYTYFEYYIEMQSKRTKKDGKKIGKSTLSNYRNALERIKEFETDTRYKITFESIDLDFYYSFVDYLENSGKYKLNTIGKYIKTLKGILNDATANGVNKNLKYKGPHFVILKEETTEIYLDSGQLKDLQELDLSDNPRLDRARDLFLILCYTGQRFQSLIDIVNPKNRERGHIELKQEKTGAEIQIPILPPLEQIFKKNKRIEVISNTRLNAYIKEVCALVPSFNREVKEEYTKGGKKISITKPFHSLVCTHTGRRTFATNFYKENFPVPLIMAITGHKTETEFYKYIRMTPTESADRFKELYNSNLSKEVLKIV